MLSWLRSRLQLIHYYSASPNQTRWSRAGDVALVASLVLAIPATWYCDANFAQIESAHRVVGLIQEDDEGRYIAHISHGEAAVNEFGVPQAEQWAFFQIEIQKMRRGMPLETSTIARHPTIDFIGMRDGGSQHNAKLETSSPARAALIEALDSSTVLDAPIIAAGLRAEGAVASHNWPTWAAASLLWWVCLFVVLSVGIVAARFGTLLFMRGQAQRYEVLAKAGKCINCAYDLRGLEFSERCPECGEIQE